MSQYYLAVHKNLKERIDDLRCATLERTTSVSAIEAKIYYDHLISTYERMVACELKIDETSIADLSTLNQWLQETRPVHKQVVELKVALQNIISSTEATSLPTVNKVDDESFKTEPSETEKKLDFHTRKQIFLIRQMESLEIPDDISAVKAEVMYSHLSQLYNSFISNQIQIEASVDDDATLRNQQQIAKEIQQKVIDFQTKLKKIMQPIASTSLTESNINIGRSYSQPTQTDTEANFDLLIKKREYLIERIISLKPEEEGVIVTPERAKTVFNLLNTLHHTYNSIQFEIESQVSGSILDSQLEISKEIQIKMIELKRKFKKIFAQ
ncbi:uncharacterized protein LOC135842903 [Planococcus citri]|uniref:uncharacterized protein LOC135842903 n=1 Tax=Planococcus citri TaxID=170843 RepID=UPI0031F99C49